MRKLFAIFFFALFIALTTQARAGYFPSRPSGAAIHTVTGILTWFGRGNGAGTISVRDSSGVVTNVYTARMVSINGVIVQCPDPRSPDCTDWPTGIVLGTTVVTVSYWIDPSGFDGRQSYVSDQIDVGTHARSLSRKR